MLAPMNGGKHTVACGGSSARKANAKSWQSLSAASTICRARLARSRDPTVPGNGCARRDRTGFPCSAGARETSGRAISRRLACARADVDRALDALIENALRYSPGGSTVTIAVQPSVISVLDAGPGLAEDEFEFVFERFHRGRAGRAGGAGTGLGLAIARELAREWGGEVTINNRPEGGAVAMLRLKEPS